MMERALLGHLEALIGGLGLSPAPKLVGVIEPSEAADLPALVLSIEENARLGGGLGERASLVTRGVLPWAAEVQLTAPFLPGDPSFSLLDAERKRLSLPHGGLVRSNGASAALGPADIQVALDGVPRSLVSGEPGAAQFSVEPLSGALLFGEALPAAGTLTVDYFLGQWERRVVRGQGVLRLVVVAADAVNVRDLSDRVLSALGGSGTRPLPGLSRFNVAEIGSIGMAAPPLGDARRRNLRFRFEFEQEINVPESSGGIIQRIPVQALLE
jgi:hypothetical protein